MRTSRSVRGRLARVVGAAAALVALRAEADPPRDSRPVVVVVESGVQGVDPAAVRAAVARELGSEALGLAAVTPRGVRGTLVVAAGSDGRVVVVYRDASGREASRAVPAPAGSAGATVETIALLAGNLARDQVDEVLAEQARTSVGSSDETGRVAPSVAAAVPRNERPIATNFDLTMASVRRVDERDVVSRESSDAVYRGTLDAVAWSTATVALLTLGTGIGFQIAAADNESQLERASSNRDPVTNLPLVPWNNVAKLESDRALCQTAAFTFFAVGGAFAALSGVFFALPRRPRAEGPRPTAPGVQLGLAPGHVLLGGTF